MTTEAEKAVPVTGSMLYSIEQHQHLFAAWAASRAASVKGCRFKVRQGREILEASGFTPALALPDQLPAPEKMDEQHQAWRDRVIESAQSLARPVFTHGVAAKLINVYLKCRFVCGGHHAHERVLHLHPPIDDELLKTLINKDVGGHGKAWKRLRRQRWSKFSSDHYQEAIALMRQSLTGEALWKIEEHWKGNQ